MKRRDFLLALAALAYPVNCLADGEQNKTFLPIVFNSIGKRIGVFADLQLLTESESVLALMKNRPVDFWCVGGDVMDSYMNSNFDQGWKWTIDRLNELGKPWSAAPGNHDLAPPVDDAFGPVNLAAVAAWAKWIGPLQFVRDTEYSRIIGLNYHDWSTDNQAWLSAQLATTKHKIIVQHLTLTGVVTGWLDIRAPEKLAFFQEKNVSLIVTGHRHQFSATKVGEMMHVVIPAVSYVFGPNLPDAIPGSIWPMSYPMRGWVEIVDGPGALGVEVFRGDGENVLSFAV